MNEKMHFHLGNPISHYYNTIILKCKLVELKKPCFIGFSMNKWKGMNNFKIVNFQNTVQPP